MRAESGLRRIRTSVAVLAMAALVAPAGCGGPDVVVEDEEDEFEAVPDGKADDYFSDVAAEFEVSGTVVVKLDPARAADKAYREDRIQRRLTAVALFLTAYMTNKLERFFQNMSYGGFSAMARNHTMESGAVVDKGNGELEVKFTIDVAGPKKLLSALPNVSTTAGKVAFELAMPQGYESDPKSVDRGQIRNFDAATYAGAVEKIRCDIVAEQAPADAWPDFKGLLGDGTFDITLFYGHDYNNPRSDLQEAREAFSELQELGFKAPVASFEQLKRDSGAFTRTIKAAGKSVAVQVRVFHSDMFADNRKAGHDTALAEVAARDVFFYNGHAGPFYGFYLSDDKPNDVRYEELKTIKMPSKQQIIVAQGCQTYSQYADMFLANPAKTEKNLDVITTVNFSYGIGTMGILSNLLRINAGRHSPQPYGGIIRQLNSHYWNEEKEVFYGVHGIAANPRIHPYADASLVGTACTRTSQCGDAEGNVCARVPGKSGKSCGIVALEKAKCPTGTKLYPIASGSSIKKYACMK